MRRTHRHLLSPEQQLEMLDYRYIVVPGALWAVALVAAVVGGLTQPPASPAQTATPAEEIVHVVIGA